MPGPYINDEGFEIDQNKIIAFALGDHKDSYKDAILPLVGQSKRDWFTPHFYYCLPLVIGNQYGFAIQSLNDVVIKWDGSMEPEGLEIKIEGENNKDQAYTSGFGNGILTIQHSFALRTSPGISLMTMQAPNFFIPGLYAMTGVVETDNLRRDFTFNIKVTDANREIRIKKGDLVTAFMPIQRNFVENFAIESVFDNFSDDVYNSELVEGQKLTDERYGPDQQMPHRSGRRYFKGIHTDGTEYKNHQKKLL